MKLDKSDRVKLAKFNLHERARDFAHRPFGPKGPDGLNYPTPYSTKEKLYRAARRLVREENHGN